MKINQDANIHVCQLEANQTNTFTIDGERQGYLLCLEGTANFIQLIDGQKTQNSVQLEQYCAAEIKVKK